MKKVLTVLLCFFVFCLPLFASSKDSIAKEVEKDATSRNFSFIASNNNYYLYKDSKGSFYLYQSISWFDYLNLYGGCKGVSKEEIAINMKNSSSSSKIIERDYTVYIVSMGFLKDTYYYVKTPEGKFYSVSNKIKKININNGSEDLINNL
jgi:hypothetical protein